MALVLELALPSSAGVDLAFVVEIRDVVQQMGRGWGILRYARLKCPLAIDCTHNSNVELWLERILGMKRCQGAALSPEQGGR